MKNDRLNHKIQRAYPGGIHVAVGNGLGRASGIRTDKACLGAYRVFGFRL